MKLISLYTSTKMNNQPQTTFKILNQIPPPTLPSRCFDNAKMCLLFVDILLPIFRSFFFNKQTNNDRQNKNSTKYDCNFRNWTPAPRISHRFTRRTKSFTSIRSNNTPHWTATGQNPTTKMKWNYFSISMEMLYEFIATLYCFKSTNFQKSTQI